MAKGERTLRAILHGPGTRKWEFGPGETLRIGRHDDNDVVLQHTGISRFQASLIWNQGAPLPVIADHGSRNGTTVDREVLKNERAAVRDGSQVELGPFTLRLEVVRPSLGPAIIDDSSDDLHLFGNRAPEISGLIDDLADFRRLLLQLECEQRTGTLIVQVVDQAAKVVFGGGRVMDASWEDHRGDLALKVLLQLEGLRGGYRFTRMLEPCDSPLNKWASEVIKSLGSNSKMTMQFDRAQLSKLRDLRDAP